MTDSAERRCLTAFANEGVYRLGDDPENPTKVYVGYSDNIAQRIARHHAEEGNSFARGLMYRLPLLTRERYDDGVVLEQCETVHNMKLLGIDNVRGGMCCQPEPFHRSIALKSITHLFKLCSNCAQPGHYAASCTNHRFSNWTSGF
jgi:hypothetical protein